MERIKKAPLIFLCKTFNLLKISVDTSTKAPIMNFFFLCVYVRARYPAD